jgi:uncharacterized protein
MAAKRTGSKPPEAALRASLTTKFAGCQPRDGGGGAARSSFIRLPATLKLCYTVTMDRNKAISRLMEHEAELKKLGVEHLYLFGSTASGKAQDRSDIDLFFDHEKGKLGLFELMDVKERTAKILGRKADIMTRDSLHPLLKKRIEESAVLVF